MKKILASGFCSFFCLSVAGNEGIVTVLEAYFFREPDLTSQIVQTVRKGQKITIHGKHFLDDPLAPQTHSLQDLDKIGWEEKNDHPDFYLTIDKSGSDAYILRRFVKLITGDVREFTQNITPFSPDPTDYRIVEPLSKSYPITKAIHKQHQILLAIGPDLKTKYPYPNNILQEQYGQRKGFYLSYGRKADWDKENRFYFGGMGYFLTSQSNFVLDNAISSREIKNQIGLGPYINYTAWRKANYQISLQGALSLNGNRVTIAQKSGVERFRFRNFYGLSLTPRLSSFFQIRDVIPKGNFSMGIDFQIHTPHRLRPSTSSDDSSRWRTASPQDDTFAIPFSAQWNFLIGFQFYH